MSAILLYEKIGARARITMNRPQVLNALSLELFQSLTEAMKRAERDHEIRVVTLHGAGRSWCAGGDLGEVLGMLERGKKEEIRHFLSESLQSYEAIRSMGKPVIAVVQGDCIGGGNELNAACDLTIAADNARFGQAGPRVGSVPILLHQTLQLQIGDKRAREVTFLCHKYGAQQCLEMGWVNKVVPLDQLESAAEEWAQELIQKSPRSLEIAKKMHNHFYEMAKSGTPYLIDMLATYWETPEPLEGMRAFVEKRPAQWTS